MSAKIFSNFVFAIKRVGLLAMLGIPFAMTANIAQAVVINFDDIERGEDEFFAAHPITDQYLSQGVLFDDAYLNEYDPWDELVVSGPNYLTIGHWQTIRFVGNLPTYVSMIVTPNNPYYVYLNASGPSGWSEEKKTTGYGGPFDDTPWAPNQFIFFESALGISEITLIGWQGSRTSGRIDDLTYHYASVPAPSSLTLFGLGLFALAWRQRKLHPAT